MNHETRWFVQKKNLRKLFTSVRWKQGEVFTLTVNPLEIKAVSYKRSTALLASVLSGAFLHAAYRKKKKAFISMQLAKAISKSIG